MCACMRHFMCFKMVRIKDPFSFTTMRRDESNLLGIIYHARTRKTYTYEDVFFAFGDLRSVDRTPYMAHLAVEGTHAESIPHWRAGLDKESHCAAVVTYLELD